MPGVLAASSPASPGAIAGMKRAFASDAAAVQDERHVKKQRVIHKLRHTQPTERIVEPVGAEFDPTGESKEFFDAQLKRAIAIQCKGIGFDSARPEALERVRAMADAFMRNFLGQVRKSMSSARRTTTVAHDWIYALTAVGVDGSSALEHHLDSGEVPPSLLQPPFPPPEPADPPAPDLEGLLGPELSGRADKEARKYIPVHFPVFPPKHAWKATPVYTQRENDPRKIREKATEEGILAEQSLRKLMAAQKAGLQKNKAKKQRRSRRIKESDALWQNAMKELIKEEENRAEEEKRRTSEDSDYEDEPEQQPQPQPQTRPAPVSLQEGVHVNYDQKFLRKSARGISGMA